MRNLDVRPSWLRTRASWGKEIPTNVVVAGWIQLPAFEHGKKLGSEQGLAIKLANEMVNLGSGEDT